MGPKRKKQLIRHFGSVQGVREATLEQLKAVPGLPASVAERDLLGPADGIIDLENRESLGGWGFSSPLFLF